MSGGKTHSVTLHSVHYRLYIPDDAKMGQNIEKNKNKNKLHYILDSFRLSELVLKLDKAVAFELKTEQINIYIGNRWICCLY